jgi:hypothetical protein
LATNFASREAGRKIGQGSNPPLATNKTSGQRVLTAGRLHFLDRPVGFVRRRPLRLTCRKTMAAIAARDTKRGRTASFWLDSLRFHRQVDISGGSFNATILLIDDRVRVTSNGIDMLR